jgi:hypothetical protein
MASEEWSFGAKRVGFACELETFFCNGNGYRSGEDGVLYVAAEAMA